MTFSTFERRRLADLLLDLGPDAPTLCEGWDTRDMAAHLYVRENQPLAAAGMFVRPLASRLERAMDAQKKRDYEAVVADWAAGPSGLSPMRLVDRRINTLEHFVHHEDVRRGTGRVEPRDFSEAVNRELMAGLKRMVPLLLRDSVKPVSLISPFLPPVVTDLKRGVATDGGDIVRVFGEPGELVLWVFGRDKVEVRVDGEEESVSR